jgi:Protein of unknown function (DUF3225)
VGKSVLFWFSRQQVFRTRTEPLAIPIARSPVGLARTLERMMITTYGRDTATALTLVRRENTPGKVGRQNKVWLRTPESWRIVAAHVSVIPKPAP